MKIELEQQDIDTIASAVLNALKPILTGATAQDDGDIIFTPETLSDYLKVDLSWVNKQVALNTIPFFKAGKYNRFRKRDIDGWIAKQSRIAVPQPNLRAG